jgi:hypothetical protein
MLINIYRSPLKDEMYLYVAKADLLEKVPEQLLTLFGKPYFVTTMLLKVDKKLARAKAEDVYSSLIEKGYYLQMPPPMSNEMRALADKNSKLSRI